MVQFWIIYPANCCASFSQTFNCPELYVTLGKIEINIVQNKTYLYLFFMPFQLLFAFCTCGIVHTFSHIRKTQCYREKKGLNCYINWWKSPWTAKWDMKSGTFRGNNVSVLSILHCSCLCNFFVPSNLICFSTFLIINAKHNILHPTWTQ